MDLLKNLNPEQLKAVLHKDGPLLIVAGAGTGKTTAITQRIAYLIEQGLAKPEEILAMTFTEKAAAEMDERVGALLPFGYLDLWIMTFHSFGQRILNDHGLAIGLSTDAKLLNEFEQWALVKKNLDKFDLDYYRPLGNPTKFISALVKHFSRLKDEDISPADYLEYADGLKQDLDGMLGGTQNSKVKTQKFIKISHSETKLQRKPSSTVIPASEPESSLERARLVSGLRVPVSEHGINSARNDNVDEQEVVRINELANAYHVYQQLLLDNNALDFGDLINYCLKLFRQRPAILEMYRQQFKYILVDEFQDTNWAQYELIKMLVAPKNNLVVVGDDDQSIYKFRGASLSNILQFKKDFPQSYEIALVKNYRNRQNILDLSYEFIKLNNPNRLEYQVSQKHSVIPASEPESRFGRAGQVSGLRVGARNDKGEVKNQNLSKKLIAENAGDGTIEVIKGVSLADEVKKVVEKIVALKNDDKQASLDDFAILVRANDAAKNFIAELEAVGLPYIFLASRGLYAKPIIMDVIAYFKLLDNYHESTALYRILNLPFLNFSHEEIINLNEWAKKRTWSLYEVMAQASVLKFNDELNKKIEKFMAMLAKHAELARQRNAVEVMQAFLNDSGYVKYLNSLPEAKQRENYGYLNNFLKRIESFLHSSDDKSVKAFLTELNMEIEAGEEGTLSPDLEAGPEAVKILTVHGAKGLEFKYIFIANLVDLRFPTTERREQIPVPDALVKEILPQGDIHLEEERRLFYVAMTRAKLGLFMSWAPDYGGAREKKASRFLMECGLVENKKHAKSEKSEILPRLHSGQANPKFKIIDNMKVSYSLPTYYSYTQLAAYEHCPYQYRLAHILKVPARGKAAYSFGQTMHSTLQKLFNLIKEKENLNQTDLFGSAKAEAGKKVDLAQILKLYEESWIDYWYPDKNEKAKNKKRGVEILKKFYELHRDNWPKVSGLETAFNLKINGETIYGKIDRIDRLDDGVQIVDYKTGAAKTEEKLDADKKLQLLIYQMAASQAMKENVKNLQFYYLDDNSELNFIGSDKDINEAKVKIIKKIEEIKKSVKNNDFPPKPGKLCQFCDYFEICEYRQN